ncbi:MAG: hypothetical protein OHK0053_04310 [Microscillaceae bacterium]
MMHSRKIINTLIIIGFWAVSLLTGARAQNPDRMYEAAIEAFNAQNTALGFQQLDELLQKYPDYEDALYARSYYLIEQGYYREALGDYHRLLALRPEEADLFVYRGQAYMALALPAEAEQDFLYAWQMDSTALEANLALGTFYLWMELYADAPEYFENALRHHPQAHEAHYYLALLYFLEEKYEPAFAKINQYLTAVPQDLEGHRLKVRILLAQRRFLSALDVYKALEKIDTLQFAEDDFLYWGQAYYSLKKWEDAQFYLELPEKPILPELWHYLGKTYFQLNEQEKALAALNQAILLAEDSLSEAIAPYYYNRAVVLARAQKHEAAQQDFLKALLLMPEILVQQDAQNRPIDLLGNLREILASQVAPSVIDSARAKGYLRRAEQHIAAGDSNRAVRVCEQALALDSLQASGYLLKARALAMMKKTEEAKQVLERAQAFATPKEEAQRLYLLALVYRLQFKDREAQSTLDEALRQFPEEANLYQEKAFWALQAKQSKEALFYLGEALRLDSTLTQTRGERAALYLEMGQFEAVLKDCQVLLAQDETDVLGLYYQGRAYEALGAIEEALEAYRAILWLFPQEAEVRQRVENLQKKRKP